MIQTHEIGEKPYFGPDFGLSGPNWGHQFLFFNLALSVTRYHGLLSSCARTEKN